MPLTTPQVGIGNVAAVGYDSSVGKLLVVDDAPGAAPQSARLVVFDTRAGTTRIAATLNLGAFTKVSLTATGDGTFILTGGATAGWTAYRFAVTAANQIQWLGRTSGAGVVLADPLPWQEGPGLFVQVGQDFDTVDLPPGAFTPAGSPGELDICDQPLVLALPPPATVPSCRGINLAPPSPSSG